MTTRVMIINLGPSTIEVQVGKNEPVAVYSGQPIPAVEGYVYEGQQIVVSEVKKS